MADFHDGPAHRFVAAFFTWMNPRSIKTSVQLNEAPLRGDGDRGCPVPCQRHLRVLARAPRSCVLRATFCEPQTFHPASIFAGTSVAVLTYIGFDAVSTFSEEAENPCRNILMATLLGGCSPGTRSMRRSWSEDRSLSRATRSSRPSRLSAVRPVESFSSRSSISLCCWRIWARAWDR